MGNQNFIVINGNKYDAVTGKLLTDNAENKHTVQTIKSAQTTIRHNTGVVDGFVKPQSKKSNISRQPASNAAKNPQKSQTLARKAVRKPEHITNVKQPEKPGIHKKKLGVSPRREFMAREIQKSPHIRKFGEEQARSSVVKKQLPLPVKQPPTAHNHVIDTQGYPQHHSPNHQRASSKMIEAALANAESHNEQSPLSVKKSRRSKLSRRLGISSRAFALSSGVLAFVLLAGFYAVQNVPNLSMKVAASRAGFDARMPGYTPSGFSFRGPINYEPGEVAVKYHANSDDREFSVVQRNSNWNSDALLANFIEEENKQYQTYLDRGRTLYIYDESNATWIDDGIWYQIEGDSGMTTDQLIRIASSI